MSNNKFFLMVVIAIVFIYAFMDDPSFVMGYITVLCSMLVLGTLSYDEFDNGYAFLLTLPITRKLYVKSKYIFSIVYTLVVWLIACCVLGLVARIRGNVFDISFPVGVIASCYIFISLMIPVQLKFGSEKSRIAIAVIVGGLVVIGVAAVAILSNGIYTEDIELFVDNMSNATTAMIVTSILLVTAAILFISYNISAKIMVNKEL